MKSKRVPVLMTIMFTTIVLSSCTKDKLSQPQATTADFLVANVDSIDLERTTEVRIFVGDSLWEYINGGAELYHLYNFVEVATAYYRHQGTEVLVDIYKFDAADHAYGIYSMLRPDNSIPLEFGVEGFGSSSNLVFVKGAYVVMLTGFEQTEAVGNAIAKMAPVFEGIVPGSTDIPTSFALLPSENALTTSNKLFASSFLGLSFLDEVYSRLYILDGDTVTLFVTDDAAGVKFIEWKQSSGGESTVNLPFDDGMGIKVSSSYHGDIIAGLRKGRLIGIIGYKDGHRNFLTHWLETIPSLTP